MSEKRFEVNGNALKMIAVITMFVDHFAAGFYLHWLGLPEAFNSPSYEFYCDIYHLMRGIGRMAFPIYCFMLVEGFFHTRNIKNYCLRLIQIAIISEIPFDLALRKGKIDFLSNNVLWELLLGLIVLCCMDYVLHLSEGIFENEIVRRVAMVLIMFLGMGLAYITKLDYRHAGIACIAVIYFLYGATKESRLTAFAVGVLMLTLMSSKTEAYAAAMLVPLFFYNGKKGSDSVALRRFFYSFYPVHLILIYLLRVIFI
ncbi:TraX protein [Pseudobutyrivibrio sp. YE44]|uniref:TraX family protein n=1 Tax=Pseudobutyrivibrio sp. YE44 TaxID=1520802 RepID=UPI0008867B39|nr:TraX family protein [Pseudobutyrivibrio sp. YE44]SDB51622.1 TraX protein [Pseudobutyrivibrio sp. YE44]